MDDIRKIRLNKSNSIYSRNTDEYSDVTLKQTTNIVPNVAFNGSVDIDEIFRRERDNCTKYRLILTINPFCTNVLFNMCTEIVHDEGSIGQEPILDNGSYDLANDFQIYNVFGKRQNLSRADMVRNTEYSREDIGGFTYHPGMDIFNNHIARNKTNKVITFLRQNATITEKNEFNTLWDYTRDFSGKKVMFEPRKNIISSAPVPIPKHQYTKNDIYDFITGDSYYANVSEEGGWVGFKNTTTIDAKDGNSDAVGVAVEPMDIGRLINNRGNCEFIDMYPDRTLFLFTPKYNEKRNRLEYNWDIELTYPYKNFYNHPLVKELVLDDGGEPVTDSNGRFSFGDTEGLLLQYGKRVIKNIKDPFGEVSQRAAFEFRSFVKHRLNRGVYLNVYYRLAIPQGNTDVENYRILPYEKYSEQIMVASIGDADRQNSNYYFNVTDDGLYNEMISKHCLELFYQPTSVPNSNIYTHKPEIIPVYNNDRDISFYEYVIDYVPLQTYTDEQTFTEVPYETYYSPDKIRVINGNTYTYYERRQVFYTFTSDIDSDEVILEKSILAFNKSTFRIRRVVSGVESEYYFRVFRKIPNFKFAHELLSDEVVDNGNSFEGFVEENASYENEMLQPVMYKFDNEWYDLAFSKTIYGDQITQVAYSDLVDIDKLVDNLGRPLTKIYATIIKTNNGHKEWYCSEDKCQYELDSIEYSRCFGDVKYGIPFLYHKNDRSNEIRKIKGFLSDARMLRNTDFGYDTEALPRPKTLEWWYNKTESVNGMLDNEFFGDIVDFNPVEAYEITLENVNFRFNTEQRESDDSIGKYVMWGDELVYDDFSENPFEIESTQYEGAIIHPEGYIYEPHYEIMVRELSEIQQSSHYRINVGSCEPVSLNGMFLKIRTNSTHKCSEGDTIFMCDDDNSIWYETSVVYTPDAKTIIVNVISPDSENYINWIELTEKINDGNIIVRKRNAEIPSYARRVSVNDFVWRKINKVGDTKNVNLKEYPFTNGSFYIDRQINFFLKRQDPDGYNKLHGHRPDLEVFDDADGLRRPYMENERVNNEDMVC